MAPNWLNIELHEDASHTFIMSTLLCTSGDDITESWEAFHNFVRDLNSAEMRGNQGEEGDIAVHGQHHKPKATRGSE